MAQVWECEVRTPTKDTDTGYAPVSPTAEPLLYSGSPLSIENLIWKLPSVKFGKINHKSDSSFVQQFDIDGKSALVEIPWLKCPFGIESTTRGKEAKFGITLNVPDREESLVYAFTEFDRWLGINSTPDSVVSFYKDKGKAASEAYLPVLRNRASTDKPCTIRLTLPTEKHKPAFVLFKADKAAPLRLDHADWQATIPRYSMVRCMAIVDNIWVSDHKWSCSFKIAQLEYAEPAFVTQTRLFSDTK